MLLSAYPISDARINWNRFLLESSSTIPLFSIKSLMEEIRLLNTQEDQFDFRGKSNLLAFFDLCQCRYSDAEITAKDFSIEFYFTLVKFFIGTSRKEIEPVITEKLEFDYRDESIILARFGITRLSGFY